MSTASPQPIRLLPIHVANQIAAGEVVERPASVAKELIENALDAGATRIALTITAGGRRLIEVDDNGCGMGRDDALMAIERQATSKIREAGDIERIATLGFRGEALPAIASVSRFTLRSCRAGETVGTELVIVGGRLQDVRDVGRDKGTTVQVRDLFFNTPARRKFLRTNQTEIGHLRTVFLWYALAHPDCALSLRIDGREQHVLPAGATLDDRIRDLYGAEISEQLRPIAWRGGDLGISGFAALPSLSRADRSEQFVFVNGRPASAPIVPYALREAYPSLENRRRPVVFVFIELPPEQVDVNVHPTKREVRFRRPGVVRDGLIAALSKALGSSPSPRRGETPPGSTPGVDSGADPGAPSVLPPAQPPRAVHRELTLDRSFARPVAVQDNDCGLVEGPSADFSPVSDPSEPHKPAAPTASTAPWAWRRILGWIGGRYVLMETDGGYVVLDPRAAHERVLYEKLMTQAESDKVHAQSLLIPQSVRLPPEDARRLRQRLREVTALGVQVSDFGGDHFIVDALPDCVADVPCRELLIGIAHDLEWSGARRHGERWRTEAIVRAVSRTAVRARPLAEDETERLVRDLESCRMPYTCPRGRPTMLFTSLSELTRKFGRE